MMQEHFISLLYPDEASQIAHTECGKLPHIGEQVCREIGLLQLIELKNSRISDYFTADAEVIRYRQATMRDLQKLPELKKVLRSVLPVLCDIKELRNLNTASLSSSGESYLYSITEIELYVNCIDILYRGFSPIYDKLDSPAFLNLANFVAELSQSDRYHELNENLKKLSAHIHEVRSVTVGVNLDAQLRPCEAGVLSINSDSFHPGTTLDKILRLSFRNDAMTCIAQLIPFGRGQSDNRREALIGAFHSAIEEVFRSSVRAWRSIVGEYVLENTDFLLRILPEIEFVNASASLCTRLMERGNTLCMPEIRPMSEKAFFAVSLYNPDVALRIEEPIVANDFAFDETARIFVITGPNRGGKSVHTCAVGLAQAMAQLGLPVSAKEAKISPVDRIETHFPQGADDTIDKGRLGEECARLRGIFESISENSLVLLDESLSSTGAFEASYIASDVLLGFALARCRCIFSTHLHELAAQVAELSRQSLSQGGVGIDTLTAEIEKQGERSFRIVRAKPDGKSYARDIADKYGLGLAHIKEMIKR